MKHRIILLLVAMLSVLGTRAQHLRDSIPEAMRQSYIRYGERYLEQPWEALPTTVFARFKKDGNRTQYEQLCFERRRHLAALVMAEIAEGQDRFVPDIIDGLNVMMEETWWGIPAHYGSAVPMHDVQTVDLFNAETAGLLAWTGKELQPQLDRFSPDICRRLSGEIERRILRPAVAERYWWKTAGMNWNPWICSNWLTCVLYYERNAERRAQAIGQIQSCIHAFVNAYPDDGGCDEGTGYWDRAAASLFECMQLLHNAGIHLDDEATLMPKIARMGAYIYKMYIGNDYCVNFADAHENRSVVQLNVLYPFALFLEDAEMRQFAAYMAQQKGFWTDPAMLYEHSGNFPTLGRELMLLRNVARLKAEPVRQPMTKAWLPDLQIMTARTHTSGDQARGLYLAVKGGHNDESHNHNDVGSFIVYADGQPLLIDPGVGEYTSQTFSNRRYDIWTMQSQYHNLPQINGTDQRNGRQYAARVIAHGQRWLTLDIAAAYPTEAHVRQWQRTARLKANAITITDDYRLDTLVFPTRLMFVTPVQPDTSTPGTIRLGSHTMRYPANHALPTVEPIDISTDPVLRAAWGDHLYRIVLTLSSNRLKDTFTLTIH